MSEETVYAKGGVVDAPLDNDLAQLYSGEKMFPIEIANAASATDMPLKIDAIHAAQFSRKQTVGGYGFGVSNPGTSQTLRAIADKLDNGAAHLQGASVSAKVKIDDYMVTTVEISFIEKIVPELPAMP